MNIRSFNANIYKIEEFLSVSEGSPNAICVCETWLTNLRPFVGKLYEYDFVNKLSNSNQLVVLHFLLELVTLMRS